MEKSRLEVVEAWLNSDVIEPLHKEEILRMKKENSSELEAAFFTDLEFGTGGLRGIMGIGTNRMNKYTVAITTQGLANYLIEQNPEKNIFVAIAYDSRNNSRYFADVTAQVLTANQIHVYLFNDICPTPLLSYAIRYFKCQAGIIITASHNPKEYNGYKVYWNDGGQLVNPHDKNVIEKVRNITLNDIKFCEKTDLIHEISNDFFEDYYAKLISLSHQPSIIKRFEDMKIVYSPLHGTGYKIIPEALNRFGFKNVIIVEEQSIPDGNFPTVISPNPEEHGGLSMALELAKKTDSHILLVTDPDADRVGVGIKNQNGEYVLLNGNQTASILSYYLLQQLKVKELLNDKKYIVKTIVTTDILKDMAMHYNVKCYDVLTGFKYISEIIRQKEGEKEFVCGCEESYGFLAGDFVRDKDAVITSCLICEVAAWALYQGKTLIDILNDIAMQFGLYYEDVISITKKGISGLQEIQQLMHNYRNNLPLKLANYQLISCIDYLKQIDFNLLEKTQTSVSLPKSNVIQYFLEKNIKITIRPSGTEPKIKYYFSIKDDITSLAELPNKKNKLANIIQQIQNELSLIN